MRLATGIKKVLYFAALAPLALLGVAQQASAGVFTHGTMCQPYWNQSATGLVYGVDGIRNEGSAPRYVMCGVPRASGYSQWGPIVYVEGSNSSGAQTSCTVYSVESASGYVYSAKSFSSTQPRYTMVAGFTNAEMPYAAYVGVLCYMPPNSRAVLRGVATSN